MTVVDNYVFTSATDHHDTAVHSNNLHRRFPSVPTIKEVPNRGAFNPAYHKKNAFQSNRNTLTSEVVSIGQAPTIESTIISPTVTRKNSVIRQKRRMKSSKEVKNRFFYPVHAPKRKRSRRGKFRNSFELNSSMNYINIDSSMSKDLCLNQQVKAYELLPREIIKLQPKLKETTKAITIDSKNNYVIYTPNPTAGKNSLASTDPEQILDQELLKLGTPITFNKANTPILPQYKVERPFFNRYDTFPKEDPISFLHRTRSLPPKFNDKQGIEELWRLYLRRVISARIKWRLDHMNTELRPGFDTRRKSAASSVDTGYFMSTLLKQNARISTKHRFTPPRDDDSSDEEVDEPVTDEDVTSTYTNHGRRVQPPAGELARTIYHSRDSSQYFNGSLESLLNEMRSIIE